MIQYELSAGHGRFEIPLGHPQDNECMVRGCNTSMQETQRQPCLHQGQRAEEWPSSKCTYWLGGKEAILKPQGEDARVLSCN